MEAAPQVFESIMIVCFGISWPAGIVKTLRTRSVTGISELFLWFVFIGYVAGVLFKVFEAPLRGGVSPVIVRYILNTVMVGFEIVLYHRYRRPA